MEMEGSGISGVSKGETGRGLDGREEERKVDVWLERKGDCLLWNCRQKLETTADLHHQVEGARERRQVMEVMVGSEVKMKVAERREERSLQRVKMRSAVNSEEQREAE